MGNEPFVLDYLSILLYFHYNKTGNHMSDTFGNKIRELRVNAGITLRDFSVKMGLDSGNWSRVERDLALPPKEEGFFEQLKTFLKLDLAVLAQIKALAKSTRILPKDLSDKDLLEHLPVMFRRADGEEPTDKEIEHLIDWLKRTVRDEHSSKN
ncbi:helix-turn-helix transcriptional regulator [Bdellovibrionota bacterium FG-1]